MRDVIQHSSFSKFRKLSVFHRNYRKPADFTWLKISVHIQNKLAFAFRVIVKFVFAQAIDISLALATAMALSLPLQGCCGARLCLGLVIRKQLSPIQEHSSLLPRIWLKPRNCVAKRVTLLRFCRRRSTAYGEPAETGLLYRTVENLGTVQRHLYFLRGFSEQ